MSGPGSSYVRLSPEGLQTAAAKIRNHCRQVQWDEEAWHYQPPATWPAAIRRERIALYILALDSINFCFWPSNHKYEYEDLARALTRAAEADHATQAADLTTMSPEYSLSAQSLAKMTESNMVGLLGGDHRPHPKVPSDMPHRCALWNEVGRGLLQQFDGSAWQLIECANGSAVRLVQLLWDYFPGFRDCVVVPRDEDSDEIVYFLKRAQICVGDWQAALQLDLPDAESQLTTFADYRLPQLLRHWGALEYVHTDLARWVDNEIPLEANSAAETSIRAATVVAVEELVKLLTMENTTKTDMAKKWTSVQVDWYLWQVGEKLSASNQLAPHHRVRTIYY